MAPVNTNFAQSQRLDIGKTFDEMRSQYQAKRISANWFIYGFPGSGKTRSLLTARKPVVLFQFDPNGSASVREGIDDGSIIVIDFSADLADPDNFARWERTFHTMHKDGVFEHVGTVALDSLTTWTQSMATRIMHKNGRPFNVGRVEFSHGRGSSPPLLELRDYGLMLTTTSQYMGMLAGLSCDTVAIAHAKEIMDEMTGSVTYQPLLSGQLKQAVPLIFDEVYVADVLKTKTGPEYVWHTYPHNRFVVGRSRYANQGDGLEQTIPQDFKGVLDAIGMDTGDLPLHV